jgi:hypothetical protein
MRVDRRSVFKQNSRRNTVLFGDTIHEAHPEGVSHTYAPTDPCYLIDYYNGMIVTIRKHHLSQLEECPECETPMVACERGDYLCCWCRDAHEA